MIAPFDTVVLTVAATTPNRLAVARFYPRITPFGTKPHRCAIEPTILLWQNGERIRKTEDVTWFMLGNMQMRITFQPLLSHTKKIGIQDQSIARLERRTIVLGMNVWRACFYTVVLYKML